MFTHERAKNALTTRDLYGVNNFNHLFISM